MSQSQILEKTLKAFKIIKQLDKGKLGAIYQVEYTPTNKFYTLKQMEVKSESEPELNEAVSKEAEIYAEFDSPYMTRHHEKFYEDDKLNIISDFYEAGDLDAFIQKSGNAAVVDDNLIIKHFTRMCLGLNYLHSQNVIYKNLNSKNIFLAENNNSQLSDMGLMPFLTESITSKYPMKTHYPAPEVVKDDRYSVKSDIWDMGCITYELCALKVNGKPSKPADLYHRIKENDLSLISENFCSSLTAIMFRCLAQDPSRRNLTTDILILPLIRDAINRDKGKTQGNSASRLAPTSSF